MPLYRHDALSFFRDVKGLISWFSMRSGEEALCRYETALGETREGNRSLTMTKTVKNERVASFLTSLFTPTMRDLCKWKGHDVGPGRASNKASPA